MISVNDFLCLCLLSLRGHSDNLLLVYWSCGDNERMADGGIEREKWCYQVGYIIMYFQK